MRMMGLIGRKVGMTQIFDEKGEAIPVTVIEAGPCTVSEVRSAERNGYQAIQLGFGTNLESRFSRPVLGQFKKRNLPPARHLRGFRARRTASCSSRNGRRDMNAKIFGMDGSAKGEASLPDELFAQPVHEHLLWLSVKRHLGDQRQGTAKVKTRGEVSGGGRKPWRQKGTGRARSGSNTSPLWPGGGRAFGPKPRDHRTEMPRTQRRKALLSALSLRASENAVSVVDALTVDAPKTSHMASVLKSLGLEGKRTLLVLGGHD